MSLVVQPALNLLTILVTDFITDKQAASPNAASSTIATAKQLLIAIENAKNIYEYCVADRQSFLEAKEKEFREMLACLQKVDFCRLNLPACIRHSIDTGTSDGWFPKLYDVNPQYVVPRLGVAFEDLGTWKFTVELFGKWKYAAPKTVKTYMPKLFLDSKPFEPIHSDQHTLTFQPTFSAEDCPFLPNQCSRFTGSLVVPYEVGNLGAIVSNQRTFTFEVLIFALPINAGMIAITSPLPNGQLSNAEHIMKWGDTRVVELTNARAHFIFTSFDGKRQEFTAADLEKSAKAVFPNPFTKQTSYLKITQVATAGEGKHKWNVEIISPIGL